MAWSDSGPHGYGWYCYEGDSIASFAKVKDLEKYDSACIHLACNTDSKVSFDKNAGVWKCVDEMTASAMQTWDLATQAGTYGVGAKVSRSDNYDGYELFNPKNGGYFVWNFDKDQFCWNAGWDSKKVYEVCYDATTDGDNYKLKNKDSDGHYIVELAIAPHDGNVLKFTCKDSSDQLYANC